MGNLENMEEGLIKMEAILHRMETEREMSAKQLQMYRETLDDKIGHYDKRIESSDRKWTQLRNVVLSLVGGLFLSILGGGAIVDRKASKDYVQDALDNADITTKEEVLRGFGSVISDTYDSFETMDQMTHEEAEAAKGAANRNIVKEILPSYRTRTPQQDGSKF